MTTVSKSTSKFTPAMEQEIRDAAPLNQTVSQELARKFGLTEKSVTAKAVRMGVAYERKQATSKNGQPVQRKEAIVTEIETLVGASLDGLEKASKVALQRIRTALAA